MNNYIDDNYYYNTFYGELIPLEEIEKYVALANNEVRLRLFNRSVDKTKFEEIVKATTCRVAEILYNQSLKEQRIEDILNGTNQIVTSEKVGDYSRNLSAVSLADLKADYGSTSQKIDEEVEKSLLFTGLLYSGVIDVR